MPSNPSRETVNLTLFCLAKQSIDKSTKLVAHLSVSDVDDVWACAVHPWHAAAEPPDILFYLMGVWASATGK